MELIYYLSNDATGQSQLAKAIANLKYPNATVVDTAGKDNTAMAALVSGLSDGVYDDIVICMPLVDTHEAGKFTVAQAITLIPKLKAAKQGTNVTGTCQANSTLTNIKLAADASAVDDFYNLKMIATTGDVAVSKLITDYNGTTKVCTVSTTGSAVDVSEDYTVYMTDYLHIVGETYGTSYAGKLTWDNLFPDAIQQPLIVSYMNNADTLYEKNGKTATSVAAGTLTDTGEFTLAAYDDLDYYVAIESATVGGGQIRKITENTANVLTLESNWDTTPTGTVVYQVVKRGVRALWNIYLPLAIRTYLSGNTQAMQKIWNKLLDRYGDMAGGKKHSYQDLALLEEYVEKGKVIAEAKWAGTVS